MKRKGFRSFLTVALISTMIGAIAGCGNEGGKADATAEGVTVKEEKTEAAANSEEKVEEQTVRTVVFQTADSYAPTAYLDQDGNPAGFEVEVIQAVDELLPQYEFIIEAVPRESLENNLISKKSDVVGFKMTKAVSETDNLRAGNEQYDTIVERIFILAENVDKYHEIADFAGKTVYCFPDEEHQEDFPLNVYNREHPDNPINIVYLSDPATCVNDLKTGKADGFTRSQPSVISYSERFGVELETAKVGSTKIDGIYYMYRKDEDQQLIDDIDGALKTLKENGTIDEIHGRLFYGTPWNFEGDISEWVEEHPEYLKESEY